MQDLKNLNCLRYNTKAILLELIENCTFLNKYVLVGGSALTLHLCHRKSEDLDFFTYDNSFNKKEIFEYLKKFQNHEILNQDDDQIDVLINNVNVTFFNAKWSFLKPIKKSNFNLASIESIAAMKVNVLFLRAKYRDYYDLYFIARNKLNLKEMFNCSLNIMKGVNFKLFAIALTYIDDLEDDNINHLEPVASLDKKKIRAFFQKELQKLKNVSFK